MELILKTDLKQQYFANFNRFYSLRSDNIHTESPEEKVSLLILRDLLRSNWQMTFEKNKISILPPTSYDKETIKQAMTVKRNEVLQRDKRWLDNHIKLVKENICSGEDVLKSKIKPVIEVCEAANQHNIFRIFRYYWSSAYSDYVGRRIKIIIRDGGLPSKPIIGIAALGSPIIHIPERDEWIGWDKETRTKGLINTMDAYVIGAIPPYSYLLGGKLISYILASNEVRAIYKKKYRNQVTLIDRRKSSDLVCIFTTSLYGKSSQYNRIKYNEKLLYIPIGETRGYGTFHLSEETFCSMIELLRAKNVCVLNKFGEGPSWRMRVVRTVGNMLGFDPDYLLRHSFKRHIYAVPLAHNFKEYLLGEDRKPLYYNYSLKDVTNYWKERWYSSRRENIDIIERIKSFRQEDFHIC